ncbi:transcription initiation factor IIE subunit beta-like [Artemia franciscana]|uniref:transcription initiation factor IIE subunit beta-like n=1 Tax=Artemia franciscana TaxID=6661 RepID=UPI0032DAAD74
MDPSLLKASKSFKRRSMKVPSVKDKKKKKKEMSPLEKTKMQKMSYFAASKLNTSKNPLFVETSPHKFSALAKIVKHMQTRYLEGNDDSLSLKQVLGETDQLDICSSTKTWLAKIALPDNPKLEITSENRYIYKPVYNIRDKKSFLKLLKCYHSKGLGGISLKDIKESLPNSEKILNHLHDKVIFLPGADKDVVLFYNDGNDASFEVDEDVVKEWRLVSVGIDDKKIEDYLQKRGMKIMENIKKRQMATIFKWNQRRKRGMKKTRDNNHLDENFN